MINEITGITVLMTAILKGLEQRKPEFMNAVPKPVPITPTKNASFNGQVVKL